MPYMFHVQVVLCTSCSHVPCMYLMYLCHVVSWFMAIHVLIIMAMHSCHVPSVWWSMWMPYIYTLTIHPAAPLWPECVRAPPILPRGTARHGHVWQHFAQGSVAGVCAWGTSRSLMELSRPRRWAAGLIDSCLVGLVSWVDG